MNAIQIITDSCCDLPVTITERYGILVAPMGYSIAGVTFSDDSWKTREPSDFYSELRAGALATTSQVTAGQFSTLFSESLERGRDVLYIGFSSALSGTFNAASLARNTILRDQPDAQIHIVDSLSASMGGGLLVLEAARLADQGASVQEIVQFVEENKLRMNHWFTVDDLEYLRRGGRLSHFSSAVGSLLQVKPVLHVDNKGRLVPVCKVRGRRKAIDELCRRLVERIDNPAEQTIAISHADCEDDARLLESRIREQVQVRDCIITPIGPAVGAHSGPDTLSLFFWGQER
ncbi:MAG: DegV family protein [Limnochordia bacterium]|jgi:DegV family protein with EDD domain